VSRSSEFSGQSTNSLPPPVDLRGQWNRGRMRTGTRAIVSAPPKLRPYGARQFCFYSLLLLLLCSTRPNLQDREQRPSTNSRDRDCDRDQDQYFGLETGQGRTSNLETEPNVLCLRLARAVEPGQNENPVKDGSDRQRSFECRQLSVDAGLVRRPNPNRVLVDDIVRGRATEVAVCIIRTTTSVATRARTTTRV